MKSIMKSKKAFPFINLFIAAAASIVLLVPLRIYQYLSIIESDTGFYSKYDFSVYAVYAVMLFIVVFSFVVSFAGRKNVEVKRIADAPGLNACAFLLAGVGFASDTVDSIVDFLSVYGSYNYNPLISSFKYLSEEGGVIILFRGIAAIMSAVYFALLAGSAFSQKDIAPKIKLLSLAAPVWAVMKLLMMFKTKISFINVSDLFIELFASAFVMLFLFYFAVHLSQVDKGESYYKLFAYGIPGAVFSLTCFLPRVILTLFGKKEELCEGYGISICDIAIALCIVLAVIARAYALSKNSKRQ